MNNITDLGLCQLRDALASGQVSAVQVTSSYLSAIEQASNLNSYIQVTADKALKMAQASDERRASGKAPGILEGIPLAIKDNFCTQGVTTTAGSRMLSNFVPSYESTITTRLWEEGAILLGKTNMDEFAMGSTNKTSWFGPVISPCRMQSDMTQDLVPGGSSGGSAAAVAAGLCAAALGSDTGGSIRQPAAFTGTVGIKPTYGRCSRYGMIAFSSSMDQAGPMARNVRDAAVLLQAMCGYDGQDSTSADVAVPDFSSLITGDVRGLRVGIPAEYRMDGLSNTLSALWEQGIEWLRAGGAEIIDISLPHTSYGLPAYYILASAEASSNLARYDGVRYGLRVDNGGNLDDLYSQTRYAGLGEEVRRRIMIGTYALSSGYYDAYYLKGQKLRTLIMRDFVNAFQKVDVILTPTTPTSAFPIAQQTQDPVTMYLNDVFTVSTNLAGLPAISVPVGQDEQALPLGLQFIGKAFDEASIINASWYLEQQSGFSYQPEQWWQNAA